MEIFFYRLAGGGDRWFTNFNGAVLYEWCFENNVKYKTDYYDGFKTGIILLEEKDKVYFQLRWGNTPRTLEDYID